MTFPAALVLDCGSDVPYAHLERQRVTLVHAAQPVHERDHVRHGAVRQPLHAHEFPAASLREAGDRTCPDSVEVSHTHPPCPAVRNRPPRERAIRGVWRSRSLPTSGPESRSDSDTGTTVSGRTGNRCGSQGSRAIPGSLRSGSDRVNLLGLRALGAPGDGVLDALVVLEAAVTVSLDGGVVDEDVRRAVVGGDETVALVRAEPLHCSLSHCALLPRRSSRCAGVHPGCGDRLSLQGQAWELTAPAVRTSRAR